MRGDIQRFYVRLIELEQSLDMEQLQWKSLNIWPLVRQCAWLQSASQANERIIVTPSSTDTDNRVSLDFPKETQGLENLNKNANILFLSRPAYLVETPNRQLFDRVIDPLIHALDEKVPYQKMYLSSPKFKMALSYSAPVLNSHQCNTKIGKAIISREILMKVSLCLGLNSSALEDRIHKSFANFLNWFEAGKTLRERFPSLESVYLTSWYFPDCMGITAALRLRGIQVVDVQHGKQGKFHPMYSGWTRVSDSNENMLPSYFWCWGKQSVDNILHSSSFKEPNRAFIGGLPWADFYRKHFKRLAMESLDSERVVLLTMQGKFYLNPEPIPTFVQNTLLNGDTGLKFIFKIHPNDRNAWDYLSERLEGVAVNRYEIIGPSVPVYDLFPRVTHHLTAFSSTCYEATLFSIPTMLFGETAKKIYAEEIESGVFSWTDDAGGNFQTWLEASNAQTVRRTSYIESSLSLAQQMMLSIA